MWSAVAHIFSPLICIYSARHHRSLTLYWLLVLQTELAAYLDLLCHIGTLALRVDSVRPGRADIIPLFAVCLCSCVCIVMCTLYTPEIV